MMLSAATRDYGVMLAAQALFGLGWTFRSGADVAWLTDERTALRRLEGESDAEALDESPALLRRHRLGITAGLLALVPVILWGDHSLRGVILVSGLGLALTTIWLAVAMTDHFRVGSDGDEHEAGMLAILRKGFGVTRRVRSIRLLIVVMVLLGLGAAFAFPFTIRMPPIAIVLGTYALVAPLVQVGVNHRSLLRGRRRPLWLTAGVTSSGLGVEARW